MKLRCLPEDFQVEELTCAAAKGGAFGLYRLTKQALGTPEAIEAIARRWNIPRQQIAHAGLKDRHALTTQFVTIKNGPRRTLKQENLELAYLGQVRRPMAAHDIRANRFRVILRDIGGDELPKIVETLAAVARDGVPNYFDDQRFGSLGDSGEFVALPWCRGDYERALWLALADANPHDRPDDREIKGTLRQHWGDWAACKAALPRSSARSIVTFLADHATDFRRALALVRQDLRSLYLAAFQSHLWNRMLAVWLRERLPPERLFDVPLAGGGVPFFHDLPNDRCAELASSALPLPSARLHVEPGPTKDLIDAVLAEAGLELRELRVKYPRDSFFSRADRRAIVVPAGLAHTLDDDDLYPQRRKLTLSFDLPRGAYATIVVKRICGRGTP